MYLQGFFSDRIPIRNDRLIFISRLEIPFHHNSTLGRYAVWGRYLVEANAMQKLNSAQRQHTVAFLHHQLRAISRIGERLLKSDATLHQMLPNLNATSDHAYRLALLVAKDSIFRVMSIPEARSGGGKENCGALS